MLSLSLLISLAKLILSILINLYNLQADAVEDNVKEKSIHDEDEDLSSDSKESEKELEAKDLLLAQYDKVIMKC